ncbi:hypothetical protein CA600_08450 [Paenibacillus sp. VTT E-133280]|nr:hypothetical protein CA600_08450 [Paenibacillus sp. VTT E-133280]
MWGHRRTEQRLPVNIYYFLRMLYLLEKILREMSYLFNITNQESILSYSKKGTLPQVGLTYLVSELEELKASLHHEGEDQFSLVDHGYYMLVVQSEDTCTLTDGDVVVNLLENEPEYVELVELPNGVYMYRACLMPDNECFLLIYALRGALRLELEQWFAEQSGCLAKEDFE